MKRLYTIAQVSKITGLGTHTLYHWCEIGILQPSAIKGTRTRLFSEEDVQAAMKESVKKVNEYRFSAKNLRKEPTIDEVIANAKARHYANA